MLYLLPLLALVAAAPSPPVSFPLARRGATDGQLYVPPRAR